MYSSVHTNNADIRTGFLSTVTYYGHDEVTNVHDTLQLRIVCSVLPSCLHQCTRVECNTLNTPVSMAEFIKIVLNCMISSYANTQKYIVTPSKDYVTQSIYVATS